MNIKDLLIIKPSDLSLRVTELSEKVIAGLMGTQDFNVIGLGDAIFIACSAVNITTEIAKAYVNELSVGSFEIPILGSMNAIFIGLSREPKLDISKKVKDEEKDMILTTARDGQIIAVRRGAPIEKLVTLCLIKFSKVKRLKIIAAAGAINDAVNLAINLTEGHVSREKIGISFINIYPIETREDATKKMTAISIYLEKGHKTVRSRRYKKMVDTLKGNLR